MSDTNKNIFEFQLTAIEILGFSLIDSTKLPEVKLFNFGVGVEARLNAEEKLLFVVSTVEIRNDDSSVLLADIKTSCVFAIKNFDEHVKQSASGKLEINQYLLNTLNMVSISTTRGIMFTTFKGTCVHNAILPVIDPKDFAAPKE